jgi:protease-4
VAAVVLHVDSPGGSAFASDLIWREVARLSATKPVVVYMGSHATSGGYYVSVPAKVIFAQPATITGSIGIWSGKIVTRGLFSKVQAEREVIHRGKTATLYADTEPFSDEERARVRAEIGEGYARFKARVSEGRHLTVDEVESVARGRVWTGKQAREHGLVDRLGDLYDAANHARELAGIGPQRHAPLIDIRTPGRSQLPQPWPTDMVDWVSAFGSFLQEGALAMAPWRLSIRW